MTMPTVNVHKAKTHLSVPGGAASIPRVLGTAAGDFVVPDNFNDPLPDEIIAEFEGHSG